MAENRSTGNYPRNATVGFGPLVCGLLLVSYVALGAFGAHALENRLTPDQLDVYDTATRYHQLFATLSVVLLLARPVLGTYSGDLLFTWGLKVAATGFGLFCVSLYVLSTRAITGFGQAYIFGPVTPVGGMLIIIGILLVSMGMSRRLRSPV